LLLIAIGLYSLDFLENSQTLSPTQVNSSEGAVMESETATVTTFSFSGADRMIMKPGSETFVPGFPSLTDLQSNQMLVSHSNQWPSQKLSNPNPSSTI
jgi:hypothetical protein